MKKSVKIIACVACLLVAVGAVIVFLVLPDSFAPSEDELQELEQMDLDSLMNVDVPEAPEVPEVAN